MRFLGGRRAKQGAAISREVAVLVVLLGSTEELESLLEEDLAIYEATGLTAVSYEAPTVADIIARITAQRPVIVHLLATFTEAGLLSDADGADRELADLMQTAEDSGVGLFVVGSENRFRVLRDHIYHRRMMSFMAITERNRHYESFMRGILATLARNPRFALAYEKLAPQGPESLQEGEPLPGSIAICPRTKGGTLLMRSVAQR
jgi:hypothetical protein